MADQAFCQIKASTREQRAATRDKAGKEKELLKQRPGKQVVYDHPITEPDPGSLCYCPDGNRFEQDFSGHEKQRRVKAVQGKEAAITARRAKNAEREESRWKEIDHQYQKEQGKEEFRRTEGSKAQRNNSSVPYNPITLKYNDSEAGERLRYTDDMIKYRGAIRSNYLHEHQNADGYNPISGDASRGPAIPVKPSYQQR